jgi:hypothetical protein
VHAGCALATIHRRRGLPRPSTLKPSPEPTATKRPDRASGPAGRYDSNDLPSQAKATTRRLGIRETDSHQEGARYSLVPSLQLHARRHRQQSWRQPTRGGDKQRPAPYVRRDGSRRRHNQHPRRATTTQGERSYTPGRDRWPLCASVTHREERTSTTTAPRQPPMPQRHPPMHQT